MLICGSCTLNKSFSPFKVLSGHASQPVWFSRLKPHLVAFPSTLSLYKFLRKREIHVNKALLTANLLFLLLITLSPLRAGPAKETFILYDLTHNKTLACSGAPDSRSSPYSTFKIALSLMGFESQLLHDATSPVWKYGAKHRPRAMLQDHRQDMDPQKWMRYSCVWFSQELTRALGPRKFQHYVNQLSYGNKDLTGTPGKNNGLTESWLGSSLKISPREQIAFLSRLVHRRLPFSPQAHRKTREIICLGDQGKGWILYGKTGAGFRKNSKGQKDPQFWMGWFVGWIEKGDFKYVFASQVEGVKRSRGFGGQVAKNLALKKIRELILSKDTAASLK